MFKNLFKRKQQSISVSDNGSHDYYAVILSDGNKHYLSGNIFRSPEEAERWCLNLNTVNVVPVKVVHFFTNIVLKSVMR